jgi:hypothetical protein
MPFLGVACPLDGFGRLDGALGLRPADMPEASQEKGQRESKGRSGDPFSKGEQHRSQFNPFR